MKKLNIIQIGVSHEHAPGKMETLRKMGEVFEIVGYVDDRPFAKGAVYQPGPEYFVRPYEGLRQLSLREALDFPGLDAVLIEVPNSDLVEVASLCLKKGLPMHMDKPPGEDAAAFRKLLEGCRAKNLPFQMGYMFRANPAMNRCRELAADGVLGNILEVEMDMSHDYGGEAYQRYISTFKGGVMFNLGCHIVDFLVSLLGAPERITPFLKTAAGSLPGVLNNTAAVLEYPGGALATIQVNAAKGWGAAQRRLRVSGSRGTFELSPHERFDGRELTASLRLKEPVGSWRAGENLLSFGVQSDRYADQLAEFARIVRGEAVSAYSFEHDLLVHRVTLAAAGYFRW